MPGPLPNPNKRRRNAPTVPNTGLPAEGRQGRAPTPPYKFGKAGARWWKWAWSLPQATAWDAGALYGLARRAELEDQLAALEDVGKLDLAGEVSEVLGMTGEDDGDEEVVRLMRRVEGLLRKLKSLSGGSVSVMREMRELDNRFGLNAKAMADLRWTIAEGESSEEAPKAQVRRLRAVDPAAS